MMKKFYVILSILSVLFSGMFIYTIVPESGPLLTASGKTRTETTDID